MIKILLDENNYVTTWCSVGDMEGSIEVEFNGDMDLLRDHPECFKLIDNQIMLLSLDEEEPAKTIELDADKYEEVIALANAPKSKTTLELMSDALDAAKPTVEKVGFHLELKYNEGMFVWEFVPNEVPDENDGTDYLKPIPYIDGMAVTRGLWYILNGNTNECILTASHSAWTDEYFDLVEV